MKKIPVLFFIMIFCFVMSIYGAQIDIKDIKHVEGAKLAKIQFVSNQIISMPKLLAYDETSLIVGLRFFDVNFSLQETSKTFNSEIIDYLTIKKQDDFIYDVDIKIKRMCEYRISTNEQGVFIEFIKKTAQREVVKVKKMNIPVEKSSNSIQDISIIDKDAEMVGFKISMKNKVKNFREIPIYKNPARLAIDFTNTSFKAFRKSINLNNIKGYRGAFNKADVYRIVFDLDYLKKYIITKNGKNVFIRIFNKDQVVTKNFKKVATKKIRGVPVRDTKVSKTIQPKKVVVEKVKTKKIAKEKVKPQKVRIVETDIEDRSKVKLIKGQDNGFFKSPKAKVSGQVEVKTEKKKVASTSEVAALTRTINSGRKYSGELLDFSVFDTDIKDFISMIAKTTGLNVAVDPDIEGKITGEFHQVPWDQALELFLKQNGLAMQMEGNILRIGDAQKLAEEADRLNKIKKSRQMQVELHVITRELSYAKAKNVSKILKKYMSPRGRIEVDNRTNTLIIQEIPEQIETIDKLIGSMDTGIPQVTIEARIVETKINYKKNLGIQWGYRAKMNARYGNQTNLNFPNSIMIDGTQMFNNKNPGMINAMGGYAINIPAPERNVGTMFSLGNISNTFNLDVALTAMERDGKGRIISAPKTTVMNNTQSTLKQGRQIPIQTIVNRTVSVRFEQASLQLIVTPQITPRGTIIAKIEIKNDAPDFANQVNGIPSIITQQTKTTVEIKDGDTLVIGGMYRVETDNTSDKVPLLSKIPFIGGLFRNSQNYRQQREVLMFITPRIIK
jgi:type IV pilus assembly protein PilQ